MGKIFNKGLDKDGQKEGLFKRLKSIENPEKNVIRDNDNKNLQNVFDYLKSLS